MHLGPLKSLIWRDLTAQTARTWTAAIGIAFGVMVLLVISSLGLGIRDVVLHDLVQDLPIDIIKVQPKTLDLGWFKTDTLLGPKRLDLKTVQSLQQSPHVKAVYPQLDVTIPMTAKPRKNGFINTRAMADLFLVGVPPELVQPEVPEFRHRKDHIPVVISNQLITIYNDSVAPVVDLPRLTPMLLKGFPFEIRVGKTVMMGSRKARTTGIEAGKVLGASRWAMRLGASVPIQTARALMAQYAPGYDPQHDLNTPFENESYRSIFVRARSASQIPSLIDEVESMGYAVDQTAQQTRRIMTAFVLLSSTLGLLILTMAALNIGHSFFAQLMEQRHELGIFRAVGASRTQLLLLVLSRATAIGFVGALIGIVAAYGCQLGLDYAATHWLPNFPFKPETFFVTPPWLWLTAILAAVLAALSGAWLPAHRTAQNAIVKNLAAR